MPESGHGLNLFQALVISMSLILGLKNFDLEPDTLQLAKSLLNTAQLRTGPGSGHELDLGTAALPAICAYLACVRCVNSLSD